MKLFIMEANQCRLNNIVNYRGQITTLTKNEMVHFYRFSEFYEPIPLTEEILLKCGFEKYSEGNFVLGNFILSYLTTDENFEFEYKVSGIDSWLLKDIKHLHQLQNLYFALTNEELTVNL